jgi:ApaG protein
MTPSDLNIQVTPVYLEAHSNPEQEHYLFAYTIKITNRGDATVQLIERHWQITNGNGETNEVRGPGVVGEQPHIAPQQTFEYTSSAAFSTPVGFMQGEYLMQMANGEQFNAIIPPFRLATPGTLN